MKISELINKLNQVQEEHGDVEVATYHHDCECCCFPSAVTFVPTGKFGDMFYIKSQDYDYYGSDHPMVVVEGYF